MTDQVRPAFAVPEDTQIRAALVRLSNVTYGSTKLQEVLERGLGERSYAAFGKALERQIAEAVLGWKALHFLAPLQLRSVCVEAVTEQAVTVVCSVPFEIHSSEGVAKSTALRIELDPAGTGTDVQTLDLINLRLLPAPLEQANAFFFLESLAHGPARLSSFYPARIGLCEKAGCWGG